MITPETKNTFLISDGLKHFVSELGLEDGEMRQDGFQQKRQLVVEAVELEDDSALARVEVVVQQSDLGGVDVLNHLLAQTSNHNVLQRRMI
jgi:uncharacterized lipoprotein YmbA